ncbi:MAG: hypothetical protein MUO63_08315 [Desulfobulbaceae bacterium]|nr:hypothetical protein [Desulfobulbaceae bacterium]
MSAVFFMGENCLSRRKKRTKIFGCYTFFDHAAKQNQSKYPWSQNIVQVGLLKSIKDRLACLPLTFRFYHLQKELTKNKVMFGKKEVKFQSKMKQSVDMIIEINSAYGQPVLAVTDSWFGNNGLWKPQNSPKLLDEKSPLAA